MTATAYFKLRVIRRGVRIRINRYIKGKENIMQNDTITEEEKNQNTSVKTVEKISEGIQNNTKEVGIEAASKSSLPTKNTGHGMKSRLHLYQKTSKHYGKSLKAILQCLKSNNESIKLGAAKVLMDKILPDIKSLELQGDDGEPIRYNVLIGNGFIPQLTEVKGIVTEPQAKIVTT